MARQTINTGTVANDNTGDTMRNAGTKINANFSEIYTILGGDSVTPTTTMSFGTNTIVAEGSVDDAHETTLAFTNPLSTSACLTLFSDNPISDESSFESQSHCINTPPSFNCDFNKLKVAS